jgi:hypothetical protein
MYVLRLMAGFLWQQQMVPMIKLLLLKGNKSAEINSE